MTGRMCRRVTKPGAVVFALLTLIGTLVWHRGANQPDLNDKDRVQKDDVVSLSSGTSLSSSELSTPLRESNSPAPSNHKPSQALSNYSNYKPSLATSSKSSSSRSPHYLIFIIVLSTCSEGGRDARDTIRKTWVQDCHNKVPPVLVKFSIGTVGLSSSEIGNLTAEDKVHGDLLLLTNLHDAYSNITRKVLYSFVWADQNVNFSYLLKVDDDTFIYMDDLHKEAHRYYQNGVDRLYWGRYNWKAYPITTPNHKWAEPHWFLCDHYLPYAFGSGYIISADLIHKIAITSDYLQLYNSEDVSVGVWLAAYKIQRKDDSHFHHFQYSQNYHPCPGHSCWFITTTPQNMYKLHSQL